MAKQPLVSVIIPACNEENYIARTLYSVQKAEGNKEIIVVANGCDDGTEMVVKNFKVKLIVMKERNVSIARNKGAKAAKGDVLVFLDADTIMSKNSLRRIVDTLDNVSVGTMKVFSDKKKFIARVMMQIKNFAVRKGIYKTSNGIIFCKKEVFEKVKGFRQDLRMHEDGIFVREAAKLGGFRLVDAAYVVTSVRRYEKLGYFRMWWFWIKDWVVGGKDYPVVR